MIEDNIKPLKLTLKELVEHYEGFLKECERKSAETRGTYQRALREFLGWFPVDKRFQFRVRDVERYKRHLTDRKQLKSVSVATYLTALRRFCGYLIDIKLLEANPAKRVVGGPRPERHSRTFLTYAEVDTLINAIDRSSLQGLRDFAIIRMMLDCALGEHELIHADVGDIRRGESIPKIAIQGKGRRTKDETVTLPEPTLQAIDLYLNKRFQLEEEADESAPLFESMSNRTHGARMTTRGVRSAVNKWLESSGVKGDRDRRLTPFSLRHTAGLMMVEQGATVEEVMRRMRIEWQPTAQLYFKLRGGLGPPAEATSDEPSQKRR